VPASPLPGAGSASRAAWRLLGAALVSQTGISVVEQGIPTLTGFVKTDLGLSAATAGLTVSSFTAGRVLGSYAAGVAADRVGERLVLVGGGLVTGALVAIAVSAPLAALVALLVLAGVASAASTPAGGRLVLLAFPRNRRGLALGVRQTGVPIGGLVAAALLPWIAHLYGWRWSLAAAGALTALGALPLAISRTERFEPGERLGRAGAWSPLRDPTIRLLTLWGCLLVSGQYALIAFLSLDLHRGAGLALASGSLLVAVAQAFGIAGRVGWGAISDHLLSRGRKPLLLALTAVALGSALLLFAMPRSAPTALWVPVAALAGLALIGFQGLWVTMIAEAAGPARAGAATGFGITFVAIAIALSPPLYGLVADLSGTYRAIWAALAVILALAFVPAALVHERA
jgi:MFS transporter, ACS family, aldohexuronate transporter